MNTHINEDVAHALTTLNDALCTLERFTGIESILIVRDNRGFCHRSMSGKPGIPDDVTDEQLLHIGRDDNGLRPRTLDAKWLDPECWDGCQSLLLKDKCEKYEKLLRRVIEWCETDTPNFEIDADTIRAALNPPNDQAHLRQPNPDARKETK